MQDSHDIENGEASAAQSETCESGFWYTPAAEVAEQEDLIRVKKKHSQHKARRALLITLCAAVGVVAVVGIAIALYVNSLNQSMGFSNTEDESNLRSTLAKTQEEEPFYTLLLGSDARESDTASRSDVMILLRTDLNTGLITMVSIPRDTMVTIDGHGRQKINAAYAFGGAAGAVEAVSKFAGVPISHYAEIHFEELEQLVDSLGGIWVNVPVSNDQTGATNTQVRIEAGEQLLDGEQALAFARERYGYERGDYQRADNQKLIAEAIIKQVLAEQPIELPGTISQLAGCITTDLQVQDIVSMAMKVQNTGASFYFATVPSDAAYLDGVSYVIARQGEWEAMMMRVDAGKDPNAAANEG